MSDGGVYAPPPPPPPKGRDMAKLALVGAVVFLMAITGAVYMQLGGQVTSLQGSYNTLNANYADLQGDFLTLNQSYTGLQGSYSSLTANYNSLQGSYNALNSNFLGLQGAYGALNSSYQGLQAQYANLSGRYSALASEYDTLATEYEIVTTLHVGTSLETYFDYVRANVITLGGQPLGEEEWANYPDYYEDSCKMAAYFAAHDAGQLYWPSMEDESGYYEATGEYSYETAVAMVDYALEVAGVNSWDSDVVKIDKILAFMDARVEYETRLIDHMWFPIETLSFRSGDCTSFSILAGCMFERVGIKSAVGFFTNDTLGAHAMVLVHMDDLGPYGYVYYSALTGYGLASGTWIVIEPQTGSLEENYEYTDWILYWDLVAASEVKYGA